MKSIDSTLLAHLFFGISLVVFLITLYIILPAFIYNKRTMLRPQLINAMWFRIFGASMGILKINWGRFKKKEYLNSNVQIDVIPTWKTSRQKIRGLYEH